MTTENQYKTHLLELTAKQFAIRYANEITRRQTCEFSAIHGYTQKSLWATEVYPDLCCSIRNFNDSMHFSKSYMLTQYIEKNWESRWAKRFDKIVETVETVDLENPLEDTDTVYTPTVDEQSWLNTLPTYQAQDWMRMMNQLLQRANTLGVSIEQYQGYCEEYDQFVDDGWYMDVTKDEFVAERAKNDRNKQTKSIEAKMTIKIKIDKIEKSDTYNGETVFKIEGSKLNWNGTINVEYGYTDNDKLRIKCYNLIIDKENSETGEQIQRSFQVIGRWGEKHIRWCTEYQTNWSGFESAKDAKKAMIKYIQQWGKVEETPVEVEPEVDPAAVVEKLWFSQVEETTVEETPVDLDETLFEDKDQNIIVSFIDNDGAHVHEYIIQIYGEWGGTVDVEIGHNDQGLRAIKSYFVDIDAANSKTGKREYDLLAIKDIQGGCEPSKIYKVGYDTPAAALEATIQFIKSIVKRSDDPVEETTVEETPQSNNQSTTEQPPQVTPQPKEPTMAQSTKIIVVTYHSYLQKWYPYSLENFERIILDMGNIENIQIIEKGE
jgi:hypothetical protein